MTTQDQCEEVIDRAVSQNDWAAAVVAALAMYKIEVARLLGERRTRDAIE